MSTSDYLWFALGALAMGIMAGAIYPFPPAGAMSAALIICIVAIIRLTRPDPRHGCLVWLAAAMSFGLASGTSCLQRAVPVWIAQQQGQVVCFRGWMDGFEEETGNGLKRAAIRVTHINGQEVEPAHLQVTIAKTESFPEFGAELQGLGRLQLFEGPANPGDPDQRLISRIKGVAAFIRDAALMPVPECFHPGTGIIRGAIRVREALEQVTEHSLPRPYAELLNGITLGESGSLDGEWLRAFQRSGTLHILSVSGLHVSLVSSAAFWLLRRRRVPLPWTIGVVSLCTALYVIMTGLKPPGIRSGLMAVTGLAGNVAGRQVSSTRMLGVAALAMLAFDPLLLFDASFQLSVSATAGVCAAMSLIRRTSAKGFWVRAGQLLACSLGAQMAVAPWQAYYFNTLTPVALLANLIIVPLATSALYTGFAASLAGLLWPPLAVWLNGGTFLTLKLMVGSARRFAGVPFGSLDVPAPGPLLFLLYYGALAAFMHQIRHKTPFGKGRTIITLLVTGAFWIACTGAGWLEMSRVTFLDVGQGSAALVEFRSGEIGVIDGGPARSGSDGALLRVIKRKGYKMIDFIILSHAHSDHYQGLFAVLRELKVGMLIVPNGMNEEGDGARLMNLARRNRTKVVRASAGMGFRTRSGICHFLWPPSGYQGDENGRSLVVLIETSGRRVMVTGDIAREGLESIIGHYGGNIRCDAWTVPHHGSISAYCPGFYEVAQPSLSVISVGVNHYGHPALRVLETLKNERGLISDTRSSGAVVLVLGRRGIQVAQWRKRGLFGLYMWRKTDANRTLPPETKKGSPSF